MTQSELNTRIQDLKVGDILDLTKTVTWGNAGHPIQQVTDRAVKVDDVWIPKSQIVEITYGHKYKGIDVSNTTVTECKQIILAKWLDTKMCKEAKKAAWVY